MTWRPGLDVQQEVAAFVADLFSAAPEILGIDETIPGCEVINMDPYGVGAGTLPRYIKVTIKEYHQDVLYRGGLFGLAVGDFVAVTHFRGGNRYEVTGAGGAGGSVFTLPAPGGQGWAIASDAVPTWVATATPTWLGTHAWGSGFNLMPTDASGQDLGDATHRWDLYTQDIIFGGATGTNVITVPDDVVDALGLLDAGGLEYMRVVSTNANPYFLIDPAGTGVKVGVGTTPNQPLTIEGTVDLKEQAAANPDTAAYGQIWVKNTDPNELWFTDDAGTDVQLGVGGGALPAVAGAGYALVSDGVNSWAADLTPLWLGTHTWGSGFNLMPTDASGQDLGDATHRWDLYTQDIIFGGATGTNVITVPDNIVDALGLLDAGGLEYMRVVSTDANPYFLIDPAAAGVGVGIGTADVPHGGVGAAVFAIDGANASLSGPHIQITTASDDYPLLQIVSWSHDNISFILDAYYDGQDRSSDAGSNARIQKIGDKLIFKYGFGEPQGDVVAWNNGTVLDLTNGDFGIGVTPTLRLDVEDDAAGFMGQFFNDGDNVNRHVIKLQGGADDGGAVGTTHYIYCSDGNGGPTGTIKTVNGVFTFSDLSDERRKANIMDTRLSGLGIVNRLRVRDYNWRTNPDGPVMTSFVAQEAQGVFPAMIGEALDGTLMTARAMLIPILTKAIQELSERLVELELGS